MNKTDYENKNLNELILQIRDEQPGIMDRKELEEFISRVEQLDLVILSARVQQTLKNNPNTEYFVFDDYIHNQENPIPITEKENIIYFLDVDMDTCISENGHNWVEEDACAESGTSTMRCTICGFSHTVSF